MELHARRTLAFRSLLRDCSSVSGEDLKLSSLRALFTMLQEGLEASSRFKCDVGARASSQGACQERRGLTGYAVPLPLSFGGHSLR